MANFIPGANSASYQLPADVRARLALNLADPATPEGAAVVAVAGGGGGGGTVYFGSDANTVRPVSSSPIMWVGDTGVVPVNAVENDIIYTAGAGAGPGPDTTAPTVGTLTASAITTDGFTLTVSGATDETELHATPYAFSINGGTDWTAYQWSPVYSPTGLDDDTAFSCRHRVRDAVGNVSTGTAQTVTTTALPTGTTYSTDFPSVTLGTAPPNWTTGRWGAGSTFVFDVEDDSTSPGTKTLRSYKTDSTFSRAFNSWDAPVEALTDPNVEIVFKWRSAVVSQCRFLVHASGSTGTENGLFIYNLSNNLMQVTSYIAGTAAAVTTYAPSDPWVANTYFITRLRVFNGQVMSRTWLASNTEPGTWNGVVNVPAELLGAGRLGLLHTSANGAIRVRWVGAATGGLTAPKGA